MCLQYTTPKCLRGKHFDGVNKVQDEKLYMFHMLTKVYQHAHSVSEDAETFFLSKQILQSPDGKYKLIIE